MLRGESVDEGRRPIEGPWINPATRGVLRVLERDAAAAWRQGLRLKHVLQQDEFGCGVACLAMVAGLEYAHARAIFEAKDLGEGRSGRVKARAASGLRPVGLSSAAGRRRPFSSNGLELCGALRAAGKSAIVRRWVGWQNLRGMGILKVRPEGKDAGDWHWVAAERDARYGVVVFDPCAALPFIERAPLDVAYFSLEGVSPQGTWIEVA